MKGPAKRVTVHYTHRNSWYGPFVLRLHVHPVCRYDSSASFQSPVLRNINGPVTYLSTDSTDSNMGIRMILLKISLCIAIEIARHYIFRRSTATESSFFRSYTMMRNFFLMNVSRSCNIREKKSKPELSLA